jgi:hypothetical protein
MEPSSHKNNVRGFNFDGAHFHEHASNRNCQHGSCLNQDDADANESNEYNSDSWETVSDNSDENESDEQDSDDWKTIYGESDQYESDDYNSDDWEAVSEDSVHLYSQAENDVVCLSCHYRVLLENLRELSVIADHLLSEDAAALASAQRSAIVLCHQRQKREELDDVERCCGTTTVGARFTSSGRLLRQSWDLLENNIKRYVSQSPFSAGEQGEWLQGTLELVKAWVGSMDLLGIPGPATEKFPTIPCVVGQFKCEAKELLERIVSAAQRTKAQLADLRETCLKARV